MDLELVVLKHLQEHFPQIFEHFVVWSQPFQNSFRGALESKFGEVASEKAPVCGTAPAMRSAEEDDCFS
jgi:hypothetical protein